MGILKNTLINVNRQHYQKGWMSYQREGNREQFPHQGEGGGTPLKGPEEEGVERQVLWIGTLKSRRELQGGGSFVHFQFPVPGTSGTLFSGISTRLSFQMLPSQ